jgi:hypothetical protein
MRTNDRRRLSRRSPKGEGGPETAELLSPSTAPSLLTFAICEKRIVYIIRSDSEPSRHYVGLTNDLAVFAVCVEIGERLPPVAEPAAIESNTTRRPVASVVADP